MALLTLEYLRSVWLDAGLHTDPLMQRLFYYCGKSVNVCDFTLTGLGTS